MFLSRFSQQMDEKNRIAIPARYRDQFDAPAFLQASADGCIAVYTKAGYDEAAEKVLADAEDTEESRRKMRNFFAETQDVKADGQGRLLIPAFLIDHAGLKKDVVVAGVGAKFEVWDAARWSAHKAKTETGG
ncbi:MAG TPA: division/cell wall cluster transcriptional repressor MraZ [Tepidiformaceae bacterium]|nr:division/cell wall cluster transcriptional repressor MraZ [Tepidiformaceae bacterium]